VRDVPGDLPVDLVPMTEPEIAEFATRQFEGYVADRIASGEYPERARRPAAWEWNTYFPGRRAAAGHRLYRLVAGDEPVGVLWLGPSAHGQAGAEWVYYVEIAEHRRGQGLGRVAMRLAEQDARAHGATELGLNVFGDNAVARQLYESVGYRITALNMTKKL
jgi:GNAT superfamily N-acetyltransferase